MRTAARRSLVVAALILVSLVSAAIADVPTTSATVVIHASVDTKLLLKAG